MGKFMLLLTVVLITSATVWAATLQNTDSQAYELQIQESGRSYGSQYRIIENAKAEICLYGCEMALLSTGQTVNVNPRDTVVIDCGVMSVTAGN